jgi:hypothetical protein
MTAGFSFTLHGLNAREMHLSHSESYSDLIIAPGVAISYYAQLDDNLPATAGALRRLASLASQGADELERHIAAEVARRALAAEKGIPAVPAHAFVRPGQVAPHLPPAAECMECGQLEAAHPVSPGPEEANRATHLDSSTEDPHGEDEDDRPVSYMACGDQLADSAPIEPGTKVVCPRHGQVTIVSREAGQRAAAAADPAGPARCTAHRNADGTDRCILIAGHPQDHEDAGGPSWPVEAPPPYTPMAAPTTAAQDAAALVAGQ